MKKHFTLIVTALIALSGTVSAQRLAHTAFKNGKQRIDVMREGNKIDSQKFKSTTNEQLKPRKVAQEPAAPMFMPLQEEVFKYDEGDWIEDYVYTYTYDARGNVLTCIYSYVNQVIRQEFEYDENNQCTRREDTYFDKEGNVTNVYLSTRKYDSIVKDYEIESLDYVLDGDDWVLRDYSTIKKVTRNDNGNVTGVSVELYYNEIFEENSRYTITYNADGLADTWRYDQIFNGTPYWPGGYELLCDMEWHSTDGQILAEAYRGFPNDDNNRLKKAKIKYLGEDEGTVECSYDDNGGYVNVYSYINPMKKIVESLEYTDNYGSYIYKGLTYNDLNEDGVIGDDELDGADERTFIYDEYGWLVYQDMYYNGNISYKNKYDMQYGEYTSYPEVLISYRYDTEVEDYVPSNKYVYSNFIDVTQDSFIDDIVVPSGSGETEIYNLQGIRLNSNSDLLPAGLYIVKKDGVTSKIFKK